jgi:hypothetical protein
MKAKEQFDAIMSAKEGTELYQKKLEFQETFKQLGKYAKDFYKFDESAKRTCKQVAPSIIDKYRVDPEPELFTEWLCEYIDRQMIENNIYLNEIDIQDALLIYSNEVKKEIDAKIKINSKPEKTEAKTLADVMEPADFLKVLNLLSSATLCKSKTFVWTNSLDSLATLLKHELYQKGYTRKLSNNEVATIALNTFKTEISESTIKHAKESINPKYSVFRDIPPKI